MGSTGVSRGFVERGGQKKGEEARKRRGVEGRVGGSDTYKGLGRKSRKKRFGEGSPGAFPGEVKISNHQNRGFVVGKNLIELNQKKDWTRGLEEIEGSSGFLRGFVP